MARRQPLEWLRAEGWLVLSGQPDARSEIRAKALSRCHASGDILYISLAQDGGDALLQDMADLGATAGYVLDPRQQCLDDSYEQLSAAAMVVLHAPGKADTLQQLLQGAAARALQDALLRGALLLLEGDAAELAGEYRRHGSGQLVRGLGWLSNALIAADVRSFTLESALYESRLQLPQATFIGLIAGAALALGPDGQLEAWGDEAPTINLSLLSQGTEGSLQAH